MATYYLTSLVDPSDVANGSLLMKTNAGTKYTTGYAMTITKGTTSTVIWNTELNVPRQATWGSPAISLHLVVTAASNAAATIQVKNLRTGQTSASSSSVTLSAGATATLTMPATSFTSTAVGDRLQVVLTVSDTNSHQNASLTFSVNNLTGSYLSSGITEFSDGSGVVVPSAQYASDLTTAIATGSPTGTDGVSTKLYLEQDVYAYAQGYAVTPNFEVKPTSSSYANTATNTTPHAYIGQESGAISSRRGACLSYDSLNKRYLCIGGYDGTTRFNDLWEIDASQTYGRWKLLAPTGTPPTAFNLGATIQVNLNGKSWLVVYGGATSSPSSQLLIADCTTRGSEAWTTPTQTGGPGVRYYNTHHLTVVPTSATTADVYHFGGGHASTGYDNDLYKFTLNLAGSVPTAVTWTQVTADNAAGSPGVRDGAYFCYDSTGNRLLVAGGYSGSTYWQDAWQYDLTGGTWSQLAALGTTFVGRELLSGGWDQANQRMIIFGGWTGTTASTDLNDIWNLDFSVAGQCTFTQLKASDTTNQDFFALSSGAATTDTDKNIIVEFGQNGYDGTDKYAYAYDLSSTPGSVAGATLYGLNVQDTFRGRDAPAYCYNSDRGEWLLINGFSTIEDDTTANLAYGDHHNQIWAYNVTNNTLRYANKGYFGMPYKEGVLAVYDSVGKRVLCFGGLTGTGQTTNELWELKADTFGNYAARHMQPSGSRPSPRWLMAGFYDATNNRMVVWGGGNSSTAGGVNNDLWQLDLSAGDGTWSQLTPTGTAPSARMQPAFSYDATANRLYIFGGSTSNGGTAGFLADTYYIDFSGSTQGAYTTISATGATAGRGAALMVDQTNNYLVRFGGYGSADVTTTEFLNLASPSAWTVVTPTGSPVGRRSSGYITLNGKLYMGAGRQNSGQFFNDLWSLTPNYTTPASSTWTNLQYATYQRYQVAVTGLTNNTTYKWQSWMTANSVSSAKVAYTASTAFTTGTGGPSPDSVSVSDSATTSESTNIRAPPADLSINVAPNNAAYIKPTIQVVIV